MRILITDGNSRSALAATRSLGKKGHAVITAGERQSSLASASRYSAGVVNYPAPARYPEEFVRAIASAAESLSINVVLPMTEITTLLLTQNRAALPATCELPFASAGAIDEVSNKARVIELARDVGVPIPATMTSATHAEARELIAALTFPVVVKPARSRIKTNDGWLSTRVSYARDAAALVSQLGKLRPEEYPILLQERISGPGVGFFVCYDRGRPVAYFAHRRLREKPASGGVSVLCESVPLPMIAVEHSRRLLERLNWHGVAMVEYKQDDRDGTLRLMEINGRFWGSLQLAIDAGVDFPAILVDVARGLTRQPIESYRLGIRSRWFLGDFDALLATLIHPRGQLDLPVGFPSRLRLLWDFMHLWSRQTRYEVLTLEDPRPGLVELRRWLFNA